VIGRQLDLFSISEIVGPGLVLWHPKGAMIKWLLSRAVEDDNVASGYDLVYTPNVTREELFHISGHLPLYAANQYPAMGAGAGEAEDVRYRVKPMNCPMHALIYRSQQRSYRDLPIRLSEVANVYRNEKSGTLHGLLRVRGLCMDDAHIFCTMDQVEDEIFLCLDQVDRLVRKTFGFELDFEISTRPEERLGGDEVWDRAEAMLQRALERKGIAFRIDAGGGAFYGPKIDIKFRDAIGRLWQGPTIQLDFNLPERFELEYTGADNKPHRPVMIHRAIYGTLERFTGNLIEHFAGAFPVWLSPEQVRVIPISDAQTEASRALAARLKAAGLRVHVDDRNETLNYRIREGEMQKVPYMAVIGQREAESESLALRVRGAGKKQEVLGVDAFWPGSPEVLTVARALGEPRQRQLEPEGFQGVAVPCPVPQHGEQASPRVFHVAARNRLPATDPGAWHHAGIAVPLEPVAGQRLKDALLAGAQPGAPLLAVLSPHRPAQLREVPRVGRVVDLLAMEGQHPLLVGLPKESTDPPELALRFSAGLRSGPRERPAHPAPPELSPRRRGTSPNAGRRGRRAWARTARPGRRAPRRGRRAPDGAP
jgi:hypothetical protein